MSRQHNDLLSKASNEAIFIVKNSKVFTCNEFAEDLFGYPIGDITDKSVFDLFSEADVDDLRKAIAQENELTLDVKALRKDQSGFDAQVNYKLIKSDGDRYQCLCIRDVTEVRKSESELLARDALLESISFTAARFLESKNWRNEAADILKNIGEAARVSRVYVFRNFRDEKGELYMSQQYEWVADQVEPEIDNPVLERLYYHDNGLERLAEILSSGKVYKGLIRELPPEERPLLEAQDILSIFITPIFQNGEWWGFIGYDECNYEREWNPSEIQLLNTTADVFSAVLERESIEEKIKMANKNFKSLFHQSPDGIFVYDKVGNLLDVNVAGCRLNGLSAEQLKGRHVTELVPEAIREQVERDFQSWAEGKIRFLESQSLTSDGKSIPVEIHGTNITFFDKPAILLLVRDISSRKKSEALLKKRMEFIQFISRISSEFIKMDLKNIDDAVNKALQFVCRYTGNERGYVFQPNEPGSFMNLTHEYCDPGYKPHKGILDKIRVVEFEEFINVLKNGEYIVNHFDEIPDDSENAPVRQVLEMLEIKSFINIPLIVGEHFLGYIGFDATRQKTSWDDETINAFMLTGQIIANTIIRQKTEDEIIEAKNKAEQSDRLKTAFLGQMSHEMRTPLNSIIGFAEMLERDLQNSEFKDMASYIIQGGNRLLNTFNLVIDLSEIEANVMQANLEELNLNQFLQNLLPLFDQRAREKNLGFDLVKKTENIAITADTGLLEKVIYNLVDNALKYTREGNIRLVTETEKDGGEDFAIIRVIDTGIGIKSDKIKDIFSKFRQASEGYNREFEGAGLGLSVTKGMVELMGGKISVDSKPGRGSEFMIRFPVTSGSENTKSKLQKSDASPAQELPRILVVEDEVVHQKYIRYILKDDYELTFTENGKTAIELTGKNEFQLIIMDINLGKEMNGMEAVEKIRQQRGYEKIPVIAATANVMKGHKELFLSRGFTHYLAKPYSSKDLKEMVDGIMQAEKSVSP